MKGVQLPLSGSQTVRRHPPALLVRRIGMIARDYHEVFPNNQRDYSHALPDVLRFLDSRGCDTALFSLFGINKRESYSPASALQGLNHLRTVLLEEFIDGPERRIGRFVTYHRTGEEWQEYDFYQRFATSTDLNDAQMRSFVRNEIPYRIMGNCCVLLCGESNGVKYSRANGRVEDSYRLHAAIPPSVSVILNPVHDQMIRYEMPLKRQFLSENGRWVLSVWNRGKTAKSGRSLDRSGPPWTVYHDGREEVVSPTGAGLGVEIGIVDVR